MPSPSMPRPAAYTSRGFLLVEAVLAATVIAVGLVLITRALSGQLRALETVEHHERLLALAHGKLLELEAARGLERSVPSESAGRFPEPDEDVRWITSAVTRPKDPEHENAQALSDVTLTVARGEAGRGTAVHLSSVWVADDVPPAWF